MHGAEDGGACTQSNNIPVPSFFSVRSASEVDATQGIKRGRRSRTGASYLKSSDDLAPSVDSGPPVRQRQQTVMFRFASSPGS